MDKYNRIRVCNVCKLEDQIIGTTEKKIVCDHYIIVPIRPKNSRRVKYLKDKLCSGAEKIKNQDAKVENSIEPVEEDDFTKSAYLMEEELKKRTVFTAQDVYRTRIPIPENELQRICRDCKFFSLHLPRYGKPLAVLDIDVLKPMHPPILTNSDFPTMLELLELLYCHFDIVLWSALKMFDLIPKLRSSGFFAKQNKFKITFILDRTSMTAIRDVKTGLPYPVMNLAVVWKIYPQYNEHNSVMINYRLKRIIYQIHGVPAIRKIHDKQLDVVTMMVLFEYLVDMLSERYYSFSKLNKTHWKQFKD